jgi:hypothetical protein
VHVGNTLSALLLEVTSWDAFLSSLRPVHVPMLSSTSIAAVEIDGTAVPVVAFIAFVISFPLLLYGV